MNLKNRRYFKPLDLVIIAIALISSVVAVLSQFNNTDSSLICVIRIQGEQVFSKSLSELDSSISYEVEGDIPLTVRIEPDSVFVRASACPDKLCEHTGKISRNGQSIVCLPAKVSITLESNNNELDAVVG